VIFVAKLVLDGHGDSIDLNEIVEREWGVQALAGVTGLGLPPVSVQWLEGAGDGAQFRARRVLPRDIDIPLYIFQPDRNRLKEIVWRVAQIMADEMLLRFVEDDGSYWYVPVHRIGGGTYTYGVDTIGETELRTVVTVRAGDPFWTYSIPTQVNIGSTNQGRGLIKSSSLAHLRLSGSQASGAIVLENQGNAPAYPVWQITGPGKDLHCESAKGEVFRWSGTLDNGETLTIDTSTATVRDGNGDNRYTELDPAPVFWAVPPGMSSAVISMEDTSSETRITATWRPRSWLVI
jgi:hypothetical protein